MSGRSGYSNGYGYEGGGRYDHGDGGYGGFEANGYGVGGDGGSSAGGSVRDYRPGGYGGFYPEPEMRAQSPPRIRERVDRGRQPQSSSRQRTRDGGDGLHPEQASMYTGSRNRERGYSPATSGPGAQAVEGLNISHPLLPWAIGW